MKRPLPWLVAAAMILGPLTGATLRGYCGAAASQAAAADLSLIAESFVRLIQMILAPLVFATLAAGVARMRSGAAIARTGARTAAWFLSASLVSMLLGIVMAQLLRPGDALAGAATLAPSAELPAAAGRTVPSSIVGAMAGNQILPVVLFSVLFGVAAAQLGERAGRLVEVIEQLGAVLLKLTGYIMLLAPLAVFCALASTVLTQGVGVLPAYARLVGSFYCGLALLWALLTGVAYAALGRRAGGLLRAMREPALIAFSTASSEAAYPRTLEQLERQGVSSRIAAFVLPLGYSFNMDGAAMYCTFAVLFVAQAYRVELGPAELAALVGLLLITGKGIAGVPRASLLVVAAALAYAKLPAQGLVMILAVDHLLDMGRSATNVLGNAVAAAVIARWEGELEPLACDKS